MMDMDLLHLKLFKKVETKYDNIGKWILNKTCFDSFKADLRDPFDLYYIIIASKVSIRSTCLRRKYGAVIVSSDNRIVSTGYNGAPIGVDGCVLNHYCIREENNIKHGEHYEYCNSVHAEMNAIIKANRLDLINSTIYIMGYDKVGHVYGEPCLMCQKFIKNSGINRIAWLEDSENNVNSYCLKEATF